jgi:cyclomaltodextrinase
MKMNRSLTGHRILALLVTTVCLCITGSSQELWDIIQPVKVRTGRPDTIVVSDLFYAKDYDLQFRKNASIAISFDRANNTVVFRPKDGFTGATIVDFELKDTTYSFPVIVQGENARQRVHVFRYRPQGKVSTITVTGSFNNWNKTRDRLSDSKGTGIYELALPLDPGSYIYKFVVDGKEVVDPNNPERSPTGFDDFNSVLRVIDPDTSRLYLHIGERNQTGNDISLSFVYESSQQIVPLTKDHVIALLNNNRVDPAKIRVEGNLVVLRLSKKDLEGEKTLRVMVAQQARHTNLQQVLLRNGVPAGASSQTSSWSDGAVYSIMIDRFNNGDKSNDSPVVHDSISAQANYQGGDFRGIINKIDDGYFDSLGVNILWISPVYDNPNVAFREYPPPHRWYSGYHGYWPISERNVEEKFGTMDELKELITKAHNRRLRVLLDFVAHHVHIDHPFYRDHPDWFGTLDLPDGRKNLRLWDEFRLTTWFEPYMPSFDFTKSQEALRVVSDNAIWWLKETGADGFRHDAVKHVPNAFWRELTRKLKAQIEIPLHKKVYQIGETFGDYDLIASYVNNGQLNAQFNFNLSYFAIPVFLEPDKSFASIDFHMKKSFSSFGQYNLMGNIMDSHDKVRYMAYADGKVKGQGVDTRELAWTNPPTVDHPSSYKKAELYLAYMFTIPGLPVIYYGSEFGMTGADDPDNRRMMRFGDELSRYEKQMLEETRTIVRMRNQHPALRYGDFLTLRADDVVYAYLRSDMNERLLVVLNKSESTQVVDLHIPGVYHARKLVDIRNGTTVTVSNGFANLKIPGTGWRVFGMR